ncbi:MAG TPA: 3D domain-containing protein [Terriglobales bacterium]|nr:3D domain-containing protein [Terriglobales bacterium]
MLALGITAPIGCKRSPTQTGLAPSAAVAAPAPAREKLTFEATAYSIEGKTAAGPRVREGVVAADPKVLPLGSRVRISGAGSYDGEYLVADTGRTIRGRELDIYLKNDRAAKKFGRKKVQVEILDRGSGAEDARANLR